MNTFCFVMDAVNVKEHHQIWERWNDAYVRGLVRPHGHLSEVNQAVGLFSFANLVIARMNCVFSNNYVKSIYDLRFSVYD